MRSGAYLQDVSAGYVSIGFTGCDLCKRRGHHKRACPSVLDTGSDTIRGTISVPRNDYSYSADDMKKFFGRPPTPASVIFAAFKRTDSGAW